MEKINYLRPLEMNKEYFNKLIQPLIELDKIDLEYDFIDKFFALACDESTSQYNILYLHLDSIEELKYQNVFRCSFVQDIKNKNLFTMAHQNANKLLIIEFNKFDGFKK